MNPRKWFFLISMGIGASALATSFIEQPFPDTVKEAPVLVRGKIGSSRVDFGLAGDGVRQIYTFYDLQVDEVFKGDVASKSLTIREMGGEKDGIGMHVSGTAQFHKGEDVVVMLSNRNSEGSYDIWGLMMGKLNIEQNQSGNEVLVGPSISHHPDRTGGQIAPEQEPEWTLDALRELIRKQKRPGGGSLSPQIPSNPATPRPLIHASDASTQPPGSAAPQLQTSSQEEPKDSQKIGLLGWLGLALGGLGIFAAWVLLRRSRNK